MGWFSDETMENIDRETSDVSDPAPVTPPSDPSAKAAETLTWARARVAEIPVEKLARCVVRAREMIAADDRCVLECGGFPVNAPERIWNAEERLCVATARAACNPDPEEE